MSDTHKGVISCPPEVLRRAAGEFAANAAGGIREETMLDALDRFHDMFCAHILIEMWLERAVSFGWRDGELEIHSTPESARAIHRRPEQQLTEKVSN